MIFPRTNTAIRLRFLAAMLIFLGVSASAQFNGPGPASYGSLNQPQAVTVDTAVLNPAPRDYVLHQGDTITVRIFAQSDYSPTAVIGTDGKVSLPLIGVVSLDRKTVTVAEEIIADRLRGAGVYKDPQVTIDVTGGPGTSATIIGETHGLVQIVGSRSLLDVLASTGGLPETASHVITISRPGVPQPIVVDLGTDPANSLSANIPIFPGDTIIVARVGAIYLLGSFKTQGKIALTTTTPLTLMQAVAVGGGAAYAAKLNDLRLIRTVGNHRTVVKLDMKRVMYGKDPDPILQPNDILFMPDNFFKTLLSSGEIGSILGLVSVTFSTLAYLRAY